MNALRRRAFLQMTGAAASAQACGATSVAAEQGSLPLYRGPTAFSVQSHMLPLNVRQLDPVQAAGFRMMRLPFIHWFLRKKVDSWYFEPYDRIAQACAKRGIALLLTTGNPRAGFDPDDYASAARQAAARYPDARWEVCNEPNNPPYWHNGPPTTESYLAIALPTVAAIKAGNPSARVATAGTSGVRQAWQQALVDSGAFAAGKFDACGVHPYGETADSVVGAYRRLKAILPAGIEIWATEYGLPDPQPRDVRAFYDVHAHMGIPVFNWYEIQDDVVGGDVQRYGLIDREYAPKPAYDAATSINALTKAAVR